VRILRLGKRTSSRRIIGSSATVVLVVCGLSPAATLRSRTAVTHLDTPSASTTAAQSQFDIQRAHPHLLSSTIFGGRGSEEGNNTAVAQQGNIYLTGFTDSTTFP